MPKAMGLMNPKNAERSLGGFREGYVRIDYNEYKVYKGRVQEGQTNDRAPTLAWVMRIARLDETTHEPLTDEHDQPLTEELAFSFGGKSLANIHPGKADGPEDEDPEDLGIEVNAAGNTVFLVNQSWRPHEKSSMMNFTASLSAHQVEEKYLNRCWSPDWNGCVLHIVNKVSEDKMKDEKGQDRAISYKVVDKILVGPGKATKIVDKTGATSGTAALVSAPRGPGGGADAEARLKPVLEELSEQYDGQSMTRKAFIAKVKATLDGKGVDPKMLLPILSLCKDDNWLHTNGIKYDLIYDPIQNTVMFGEQAVAQEA